jgi:transcriptional regulator with XRE-family HTH domain
MNKINEYAINVLKKKRFEKNWSQQYLADSINISRSFLRNIEDDRHNAHLNLNLINELSKVFECTPREFLPENPL